MITRRGLIGILAGAIAAPIVVRSGILMPVKQIILPTAWVVSSVVGDHYLVTGLADYDGDGHSAPGASVIFSPGHGFQVGDHIEMQFKHGTPEIAGRDVWTDAGKIWS